MRIPVDSDLILNSSEGIEGVEMLGEFTAGYIYFKGFPELGAVAFGANGIAIVSDQVCFIPKGSVIEIRGEGLDSIPEVRCRGFFCSMFERLFIHTGSGLETILLPLKGGHYKHSWFMLQWLKEIGYPSR